MDQNIDVNVLNEIYNYGIRYQKENLPDQETLKKINNDWWEALKFFLGRAFYQGRRNDVSYMVYEKAVQVLDPIFKQPALDLNDPSLKNRLNNLNMVIGKGKVGKARDIEMVISCIDFIRRVPGYNIVNYSVEKVKAKNIEGHYYELQKAEDSNGIVQVGPKVASFYLRDVVCSFKLENYVPVQFQFCLQPIDTWVRKIAISTNIFKAMPESELERLENGYYDEDIRAKIIELCDHNGWNALQFNQGAWYAGYYAFPLLLERLAKK